MVSVLTSGSVLTVVGFLLGKMSSNGSLAQLGMFLGVGAICSLVIVLFVLPGFLYLLDGLFMKKGAKEHKSRAHAKNMMCRLVKQNISEGEKHYEPKQKL